MLLPSVVILLLDLRFIKKEFLFYYYASRNLYFEKALYQTLSFPRLVGHEISKVVKFPEIKKVVKTGLECKRQKEAWFVILFHMY